MKKNKRNFNVLWSMFMALMVVMIAGVVLYNVQPNVKPEAPVQGKSWFVQVKTDTSTRDYYWPYDNIPKVGDRCLVYYDGTDKLKVARTENDVPGLYKAYVHGEIIDVWVIATGAKLAPDGPLPGIDEIK